MKIRILVTGATGMLGHVVLGALSSCSDLYAVARQHTGVSSDSLTFIPFDFTSENFLPLGQACNPDVIINCAAITDHNTCEKQPKLAQAVNAAAVGKLAKLFPKAYVIQISTDAVFGPDALNPDESFPPQPFSVYGHTKLEGERLLLGQSPDSLVLRTTIVGLGGHRATPSLAEWIIKSLKEKQPLKLYTDAIFTPISVWDFTEVLVWCIAKRPTGILHACGGEPISKYSFGMQLAEACQLDKSYIDEALIKGTANGQIRRVNQSLSSVKLMTLRGHKQPNATECVEAIARRLDGYSYNRFD